MVGQSALRWGGVGGRVLPFDAVTVTEGTKAGVQWRKNPVPRAWKVSILLSCPSPCRPSISLSYYLTLSHL